MSLTKEERPRSDTRKEDGHVKMRQKLELCCHTPRDTWGHQRLVKAGKDSSVESEGFYRRDFRGSMALEIMVNTLISGVSKTVRK